MKLPVSVSFARPPTCTPISDNILFMSSWKPLFAGPVVPSAIPPGIPDILIGLVYTLAGVSTSPLETAPLATSSPPSADPGV